MSFDPIQRIEEWYGGDHEDGDFIRLTREYSYQIIFPPEHSDRFFYCTKPSIAFSGAPPLIEGGLITRPGLPCDDDVAWLRNLVGCRRLDFVGDLDPADLMIFAWLRERLSPIKVTHHAINDRFMMALDTELQTNCLIRLNATEQSAAPELSEIIPDIKDLLGATCREILSSGNKMELEVFRTMLLSDISIFSPDLSFG